MKTKFILLAFVFSIQSTFLFSQGVDSLKIENQAKQISQLQLEVNKLKQRNKELGVQVHQSLMEKNLMNNNMILFSIIGLFSLVVVVGGLYYTLSKKTEKIISQKTNELEQKFREYSLELKTEMDQKTLKLKHATLYSLRGLYLNAPKEIRMIWLIRYCEAFYDFNELDALQIKLQDALHELNEMRDFSSLYEHFDDMKKIVSKMAKGENKKVAQLALHLLKELNNYIETEINNTALHVN